MQTLLDIFERFEGLGRREAVRWAGPYRTQRWDYRRLRRRSLAFAAELRRRGIVKGDRVLLWSENRVEWPAVFWGAVLCGAELVPLDLRSSVGFVERIRERVGPKLILLGDEIAEAPSAGEVLRMREVGALPVSKEAPQTEIGPDDPVEILYTSGSTGEPKGVVHRHRHLCANLTPLDAEIARYRRWARPFQPLRVLDLVPLSHMFGQTMGLFVPPLLEGSALFASSSAPPGETIATMRRERACVAAVVPMQLMSVGREIEARLKRSTRAARFRGVVGILERWFRHRDTHSRTGWKLWAFVVGGARTDPAIGKLFNDLGFAIVEGYGLTEASPVVALNDPFHPRGGSLGKPLPGQEVRLADDGEILVRGPSVAAASADGWLHTGDLGSFDGEGRLYFKGRKKEVIIRSDGLNVYPEDLEETLRRDTEVADCAVIEAGGRIHAAIVPAAREADLESIIRRANQELEPGRRIQAWSKWEAEALPRTGSTFKIRRGELARRIDAGETAGAGNANADARIDADANASVSEDLGLSSLDRIEWLAELESRHGVRIDEGDFAAAETVGEVRDLLQSARTREPLQSPGSDREGREFLFEPRWNRSAPLRLARFGLLEAVVLPMTRELLRLRVVGQERLIELKGPVVFAANHASHLDTTAILCALPRPIRHRLAPAMSQEYFSAVFHPSGRSAAEVWHERSAYLLACALFQAFPLPQREAGLRRALRYAGELLDAGRSLLVYPEGTRSADGSIGVFSPGVGLMAQRLGATVVPVGLAGLFEVYSQDAEWPRPGRAAVAIGPPLDLSREPDFAAAAARVERAVRTAAAEAEEHRWRTN